MALLSTSSPLVRTVCQFTGAIGGGALTYALLGTTAVVTTSYLMAVLCFLVWALALLAGAAVGAYAGGLISDKAFGTAGYAIGSGLGAVRNLFSRKAAI